MKKLFSILLLLAAGTLPAQTDAVKTYYKQQQPEKVYAHLNNVLYLPGETLYFKVYTSTADNRPISQSDYVYVDIIDPSGKKAEAQTYMVENGGSAGSYKITADAPAGMYTLKAYTRLQEQLNDPPFEKQFFVQKTIAPRVLMTLDFKKKGYGAGETCEADFVLKNIENQPIRRHDLEAEIFISGKKADVVKAVTDTEGKAVIRFTLPQDLKSNDGIVNVKIMYDNLQESVTRSIPINLNYADLQFLPEGGNYIAGRASSLFFIAKNEFGKPLDVSGYIQDSNGNKVQDFSSYYDGMGKVNFTPQPGQVYSAVITAPFRSNSIYELPEALAKGYTLTVTNSTTGLEAWTFAPKNTKCELVLRSQGKIVKQIPFTSSGGADQKHIPTEGLPMGMYAVSLTVNNEIVAERLVFINYTDGLQIEITTDKKQYLPREKVQVSLLTKDKSGKPIPSSLSVSVVDEKLLTYMDDKQHNLLTWMFFGFELKGKVHEPRFYFDTKEPLEKRTAALDLLLNTHGWRRFAQPELNSYDGTPITLLPEKSNDVEGFVLNEKNKPASLKIYLISDSGKVYETQSSTSGYFKFARTHFEKSAVLITESRSNRKYTIKSTMADLAFVRQMKEEGRIAAADEMAVAMPGKSAPKADAKANKEKEVAIAGDINLEENANALEEVVVVGYGQRSKCLVTGSVVTVTSRTFEGRPNASFVQTLQGQVAGLNITTGAGQPGTSAQTVVLRGAGSIYGNAEPMYVIDGIPQNGDAFRNTDPNFIEYITILKDAGATSIFGCRGANGVVVIKTKNHKQGSGILLGKHYYYNFEDINRSNSRKVNTPEAFYAPVYASTETDEKTDFRNCLYWNATVQTDAQGKAAFEYYNSDETSAYTIWAEGTSYKGDLGISKLTYSISEPLQTDLKLPLFATEEDEIKIPLWIKNNTDKSINTTAAIVTLNNLETPQNTATVTLSGNESTMVYFTVKAVKAGEKIPVQIVLTSGGYRTKINKTVDIYAKGFPKAFNFSGTGSGSQSFTIENPVPGSIQSEVQFITNPFNELTNGLEAMLREPYGCFEQVSSSNYPNIIALQLLDKKGISIPLKSKALEFLKNGYNKLTGYESRNGGFEWYGGNPGHEALTAYGLLQFHEMKSFIEVDQKMVARTIKWLYSRKDNKGGFLQHSGRYGFSGIAPQVNNAYIVYVLSEIGEKNFKEEYNTALNEAIKSKDVYRCALIALAAHNLNDMQAYNTLIKTINQATKNKTYKEITPQQTVISSYGLSKNIEWVSLYALAIMKEGKITPELLSLMDFIQSSKKQSGFGSTQATALALKAISTFSEIAGYNDSMPIVGATVNSTALNTREANSSGNIKLNTTANVAAGNNTVAITVDETKQVPYLFYVTYASYQPENSPQCQLALKTSLTRNTVKVSETTRLEAAITNTTKQAVPNPLVRIGIPGGTTPEIWQLKELVEKEVIAYYEMFGSELVLYFRKFDAGETRKINIDLKAQVPGSYKGVASSAYLYYDNENKNWNNGLQVQITE